MATHSTLSRKAVFEGLSGELQSENRVEAPAKVLQIRQWVKRLANTVLQATRIFVLMLLFRLYSSNIKHLKGSFLVLK